MSSIRDRVKASIEAARTAMAAAMRRQGRVLLRDKMYTRRWGPFTRQEAKRYVEGVESSSQVSVTKVVVSVFVDDDAGGSRYTIRLCACGEPFILGHRYEITDNSQEECIDCQALRDFRYCLSVLSEADQDDFKQRAERLALQYMELAK